MVGIKYNSLADLNGQAFGWCSKVNGKVHATPNEIPFERLKKEGLNPLSREYIIDKINLRRVQKDCLISYAGNQSPCQRSTSAKMWQSWPSTVCWQPAMRGSRSLCIGYRTSGKIWLSIPGTTGDIETDDGCGKCPAGAGKDH